MPGMYVFPGGSLEDADMDTAFWLNHVDMDGNHLVQTLNGDIDRLLPYAVAAIRETWEEAGVLLGSARGGQIDALRGRRDFIGFNDWVDRLDIRLTVSSLGRWHRWITPVSMPRRFDTYFFAAPVRDECVCAPDNLETVHGIWINPKMALVNNMTGKLPLSPPTLVTLHQMLPFSKIGDFIAETRRRCWSSPIMPRLWPLETGALIIEPWDPDYDEETVHVNIERLERDILPVGEPFSRLWRHEGVFRPVRNGC